MKEVVDFLAERGEASLEELATRFGRSLKSISSVCVKLSGEGKRQRIHVVRYVKVAAGLRNYPRPVYAPGPGKNADRGCKPRHIPGGKGEARAFDRSIQRWNTFNLIAAFADWPDSIESLVNFINQTRVKP